MRSRLLILILPIVSMFSCYEDKSNTSIALINPIVIDMAGAPTSMIAYSMDSLVIQPVIYKVGTPDANLSYNWEIWRSDVPAMTVSNKMALTIVVPVPPSNSDYILRLTVTDEDTGLQNYQNFTLTVESMFNKGLLIADTRDGENSDINLIMAKEFSRFGYEDRNTKLVYGLYSTLNYGPIEGLVTGMASTYHDRTPDIQTLTVTTDNHVYRMDPHEYELKEKDGEMFYFDEDFADGMNISYLGRDVNPVYDLLTINGGLYARNAQFGGYYYGVKMETSDGSPYNARMGSSYITGYTYTDICIYDELNNRFLRVPSYGETDLRPMTSPLQAGPFDLNDLGADYSPLYMGAGYLISRGVAYYDYHRVLAVMENKADKKRHLFVFNPGSALDPVYYAMGKYDMSSYEGFSNSIAWDCSPVENILYYATENKIYSLSLSGDVPVATERYQVASGEKITAMMLWRFTDQGRIWAKNPQGSGEERSLINSGNRMMVVATYNESTETGKVICIPVMYVGSGTLETDKNYHVEFDGFGRILTLAHQPV